MKPIASALGIFAISAFLGLPSYGAPAPKQLASQHLPLSNANSALGTNLQALEYWSTEWVFKDVFKMSSASTWTTGPGCQLSLDANGYPTRIPVKCQAQALMLNRSAWSGESGQYVVLYDGTGTFSFEVTGPSPDSVRVVSSAPGRIVINVSLTHPDGHYGLWLNVLTTSPAPNNVRNIRVLRPGTEATYLEQPFTDTFLASLAGYKAIRFMDWQHTNNSKLTSWASRTTPGSASQAGDNGAAVEYMVALCNALNADMWINIPVMANDEFVTREATLIKNTLKPGLKVYIEYTNEMWNGGFSQATYAAARGLELGLPGPDWQRAVEYYSQRSVEIFALWDAVYGAAARTSLVRVMGTQLANAGITTLELDWTPRGGTPAWKHVDAVAVAPYFCGQVIAGNTSSWRSVWNSDHAKAIAAMEASCASDIVGNIHSWQTKQFKIIHGSRGLAMIAYEAGQGLAGVGENQSDATFNELLNATNNDQGMYGLYTSFLNQWKADGGQLLMNYTSSYEPNRFGYWGLLRWSGDDLTTAYKFRAVKDWISANPRWW